MSNSTLQKRPEWPRNPFGIGPCYGPKEADGYVFLAQAVDKIGQAAFGAKWLGWEADDLDMFGERPLTPMEDEQSDDFHRVKMLMVSACASGHLVSAMRPVHGGKVTNIPGHWWHTDNFRNLVRFHTCTLNPEDPFGTLTMNKHDPLGLRGVPDHKKSWIFIERESLDRLIASQPFASPPPAIDFYLSPFLRVMHLVAKKLNITRENQPKKAVVEAELESLWTGPQRPPQYLLSAMATCVREYESTKGKNNKTGSEGKRQIPSGALHASPYLKAMHTVAKQLQISLDNQPTVGAIVEALKAAWSGPEPLSPTFRRRMALLLREPCSGSINKIKRAKRPTNQPKK